MKNFDFDQTLERRSTNCKKWDSVKEIFGAQEVLPFWIADMDFQAPPAVLAALASQVQHGVFGYPRITDSFFATVCEWVQTRHNWTIKPEWLVLAPGVVTSISLAIQTLTQPGDQIIIQTPVYPPFFKVIQDNGREVVENPLRETNGYYEMDFADLESKLTPKVKALLLCSPHNPVGRVWKKAELEQLYTLCAARNILILSDEIHCDLVYSPNVHTPLASLNTEAQQQVITFIAPSKTFNIAGLNCSFLVVPNRILRNSLKRSLQTLDIAKSNLFGLAAAEAAYQEGGEWLDQLLGYLCGNRDYLVEFLQSKAPGIQAVKAEATYLAWLDCRSLQGQIESVHDFFTLQAKVGLNNGLTFGQSGTGFLRLNFGCSRSLLKQGLERMVQALDLLSDCKR